VSTIQVGTVTRSLAAALALAIAATATPARADKAAEPIDSDAGIGIAAGLASLVYTPAKVLYAIGGGLAAGMAYVVSAGDQDVTAPILTPSVRGDYVVTPAHLRGEKSLEFFGREPESPPRASAGTPPVSSGDSLDEETHGHSTASKVDAGSKDEAGSTE
jgi:hypothetical protein